MDGLFAVIGAILAIGALYVVVPLVTEAYRRWRAPRDVACPHEEVTATVTVRPWRAALTSLFVRPSLRIRSCTLWPECKGCDQICRDSL